MAENRQTLSSKVTTELVFWRDESIVVVSVMDRSRTIIDYNSLYVRHIDRPAGSLGGTISHKEAQGLEYSVMPGSCQGLSRSCPYHML